MKGKIVFLLMVSLLVAAPVFATGSGVHRGNCVTGSELGVSKEYYVVYLDSQNQTFRLRYGGKGTEKAADSYLWVLDQKKDQYVVQYVNKSGHQVIHYCFVLESEG